MSNNSPWSDLYFRNCPPNTATKEDIKVVYRLVETDPPTISDFEPNKVKNPNNSKTCDSLSTTVWEDIKEVSDYKKFALLRNKKIAKGYITKYDGKIERHNNSRITWWIDISDPDKQFKVIP